MSKPYANGARHRAYLITQQMMRRPHKPVGDPKNNLKYEGQTVGRLSSNQSNLAEPDAFELPKYWEPYPKTPQGMPRYRRADGMIVQQWVDTRRWGSPALRGSSSSCDTAAIAIAAVDKAYPYKAQP